MFGSISKIGNKSFMKIVREDEGKTLTELESIRGNNLPI